MMIVIIIPRYLKKTMENSENRQGEGRMKYLLGIDAGTSNIKAVICDLAGYEIEGVTVKNQLEAQGSLRELSMERLWEKTAAAVKKLMKKTEVTPEQILAAGVTGQGEGLWTLDASGQPLEPAILWNDGRAHKEAEAINLKTPGLGALIHRSLGCPVGAGSTLVLLRWMKENRPEVYQKIGTVFFAKDWLRYKMTGDIATEITDGGTAFFKILEGQAGQLLKLLEIQDIAGCIPMPREPAEICGQLTEEAAAQMGLLPGLPVVTGAMDVVTSVLGMGGAEAGRTVVTLGTTCAVTQVHRLENCELSRGVQHYLHHIEPACRLQLVSTLSGMGSIRWAMKEIARTSNYGAVEGIVESAAPGCRGLVFHPYLSSAGERAPFIDQSARGSFLGIDEKTTKAELMRAVYESVAYMIKDCLEGMDRCAQLYLCGGGAQSAVLSQMIADVTERRVCIGMGSEFAAKGAAMLAGIAVGKYASCAEAADQCCRNERIYQPNSQKGYAQSYRIYRESRKSLRELWRLRARTLGE